MDIKPASGLTDLKTTGLLQSNIQQINKQQAQNSETELQQDKVVLNRSVAVLISETAKVLEVRKEILQALPTQIKDILQNMIKQEMSFQNILQEGIAEWLKKQKSLSDILIGLADMLEEHAVLKKEEEGQSKPENLVLPKDINQVKTSAKSNSFNNIPFFYNKKTEVQTEKLHSAQLEKAPENLELPKDSAFSVKTLKDFAEVLKARNYNSISEFKQSFTDIESNLQKLPDNIKRAVQTMLEQITEEIPAEQEMAIAGKEKAIIDIIEKSKDKIISTLLCLSGVLEENQEAAGKQIKLMILNNLSNINIAEENYGAITSEQVAEFIGEYTSENTSFSTNKQPAAGQQNVNIFQMPDKANVYHYVKYAANIVRDFAALFAKADFSDLEEIASVIIENEKTLDTLPISIKREIQSIIQNEFTKPEVQKQSMAFNKSAAELTSKLEDLATAMENNYTSKAQENISNIFDRNKQIAVQLKDNILLGLANSRDMEKLLENTKKAVRELAATFQKIPSSEKTQSSIALSLPLYFGDTPYPCNIHIYREKDAKAQNEQGRSFYDTWLRICLSTENTGVVDLVFHLYNNNILDIRALFNNKAGAEMFSENISGMREALDDFSLKLNEISASMTRK